MAACGWVVNVERCNYLDPSEGGPLKVYNVNLVRPWSDGERVPVADPADPTGLRAPEVPDAALALGSMPYPWDWSQDDTSPAWTHWRWTAWGLLPPDATDPQGRWVRIDDAVFSHGTGHYGDVEPVPDLVRAIRTRLREELGQQTAQCAYPFSRAIDDYWGRIDDQSPVTARSLVHALTPLTHWPTVVSGPMLDLTTFVIVDDAKWADVTRVACFPESSERGDPGLTANIAGPTHDSVLHASKPDIVCTYTDPSVKFVGLPAGRDDVLTVPADLALESSQGFLSKTALDAIAAGHLQPLRILVTWVERLLTRSGAGAKALREDPVFWIAMRNALWVCAGVGRERRTLAPTEPTNLLEWFVPQDRPAAPAMMRTAIAGTSGGTAGALVSVVEGTSTWPNGLSTRTERPDWPTAAVGRWTTFAKLWKDSVATPPASDARWSDWSTMALTLLSDDGAREFLGPWLSFVHDPVLDSVATLQDTWRRTRDQLRAPGTVRMDHVLRARTALVSEAQWAAIAPVSVAPGVEVDVVAMQAATLAAIAAVLGPAAYGIVDALPAPGSLAETVSTQIVALQEALDAAGTRSRPRARDRGIRFDFSGVDHAFRSQGATTKDWDQRVRGYAIALCAGTYGDAARVNRWTPDLARAQWITDTSLQVNDDAFVTWVRVNDGTNDGSASILWMHDTVGTTEADGERVISIDYHETPAATGLGDVATGVTYDPLNSGAAESIGFDDGFKVIDFGWPNPDRQLPLLAYGCGYRTRVTPIDNAGGVLKADCRAEADDASMPAIGRTFASLRSARSLDEFARPSSPTQFQFLSSEPAGAPRVVVDVPASYYELSVETHAHAYQAWTIDQAARASGGASAAARRDIVDVALLGHAGVAPLLLPSIATWCALEFTSPTTHRDFFVRWTNADRLVLVTGSTSDVSDAHFTDDGQLSAFQSTFKGDETSASAPAPYHPAVTALGFEIFDPVSATPVSRAIRIASFAQARTRISGGRLEAVDVRVGIRIDADPHGTDVETSALLPHASASDATHGNLMISVPVGRFIRIRSFSLIANEHFDVTQGTRCRLVPGIEASGSDIPTFAGYRAFGPTEHWVEVMPAWIPDALKQEDVTITVDAAPAPDAADATANLALVAADFGTASWAPWTRQLHLTHHEWHWTGYPVELPTGDDLAGWLASHAGTESYRDTHGPILSSSFDRHSRWTLGANGDNRATVHRLQLPGGARPARYAAFFARPVPRFRKWLGTRVVGSGPLELEKHIYAAGAVIPGRRPVDGAARLTPPPLRWSMPLTATYVADTEKHSRVRGANGVMLVFDEAIRRTDSLAVVGGLGDTLEIDLVDTRFAAFKEAGTNPIFHARDTDLAARMKITTQRPFGLSFDTSPNPKVTQTAMIVAPENADGRWIMAKLRARRLLLPETELASRVIGVPSTSEEAKDLRDALSTLTVADRTALTKDSPLAYPIPSRIQADETVPLDLAIDLETVARIVTVRFVAVNALDDPKSFDVIVPPHEIGSTFRLMLSWHRDRWTLSDQPSWRCQVILQTRGTGAMTWSAVDKTSCHQNDASQMYAGLGSARLWMFVADQGAATTVVRTVRMSDFTDPLWVTFIGSFGLPSVGDPEAYALTSSKPDHARLSLTPQQTDVAMPVLHPLDAAGAEATFHIAMLFRPLADVTRFETDPGTGRLESAYLYNADGLFHWLQLYDEHELPAPVVQKPPLAFDPCGCQAYVIAIQRVTALSSAEAATLAPKKVPTVPPAAETDPGYASLETLLNLAFPSQERVTESLLRFLPEVIGPISVK